MIADRRRPSIYEIERRIQAHQEDFWQLWDTSRPDHLHHYTSLDAAAGIIKSRCFWATDIRCMRNDDTEQHYAWDAALDVLAGRPDIVSKRIYDIFEKAGGIPGLEDEFFRYAVCFCGRKDSSSQWKAYTEEGSGVALSIPFSALIQKAEALDCALIRVVYDVDCQALAVRSFMDNAVVCWEAFPPGATIARNRFLGYVAVQLIQLLFRFKNPAYWRENEWRALLIANEEDRPRVLHRDKDGKRMPYIEWSFRPENFDGIMTGPEPYGADEIGVRDILAGTPLESVPISRSTWAFT